MSQPGQDGGGLLGDLPSHRPSVRSPRRKAPATGAGPAVPAGRPDIPAPEGGGTEGLIRAGASLAAAPARLGLRLAGRTLDELGKAVGRR